MNKQTTFAKIFLVGAVVCGALILFEISPIFSNKGDAVWRMYVVLVFGMVFSIGTVIRYQRYRKDEMMCR